MKNNWEEKLANIVDWERFKSGNYYNEEGYNVTGRMKKLKAYISQLLVEERVRVIDSLRHCRICNKIKPKSEFFETGKGPGKLDGRCKDCHNRVSRDRFRNLYTPEVGRQQYLKRKREGRDIINALRMRLKWPEKYKARNAIRTQIALGKIKRGPCEVCGKLGNQAHHDDYSKPLEVRWFFTAHHCQYHNNLKKLNSLEGKR